MYDRILVAGWELDLHEHEPGRSVSHLETTFPWRGAGAGDIRANGRGRDRDGAGWQILSNLGGDNILDNLDSRCQGGTPDVVRGRRVRDDILEGRNEVVLLEAGWSERPSGVMEYGAGDWEERPCRTWIWDRPNFYGLLRQLRCHGGRELGGLFEEGRKGNFPYLDSINGSPDFASATTVRGERGLTDVSAEW